jgi:hypothetical protein
MLTTVATSRFLRSAPIELRVLCEIDFTHPTGADLLDNRAVGNKRATCQRHIDSGPVVVRFGHG